jgi:hypothetical protein
MTWNEIEVKWAAMARRVGSDCKQDHELSAPEMPSDLPAPQSGPTEQSTQMPPDRSAP